MRPAATVKKKTANSGCAGQIARVRPNIHATVVITLAIKETVTVFMSLIQLLSALQSGESREMHRKNRTYLFCFAFFGLGSGGP